MLITGCQGQLGKELCRQIDELNQVRPQFQVVATDLDSMDITDTHQVQKIVSFEKPEVIINTAAYTKVDACETDEQTAFRVNALGARNLAVAAYNIGAKILQVSTDYVFDGTGRTPLREYDPVNPLSVYGKSKALGEQLVMTTNPRYFIVRTAWLYGEGHNFVRTILKQASELYQHKDFKDKVGTTTSTVDLARCIHYLIKNEH